MLKFFREIPPHILYPGMVIGILLMSVVAQVVMLVKASSDGGPHVVPNYYEKAANWDAYHAEQAAAAKSSTPPESSTSQKTTSRDLE